MARLCSERNRLTPWTRCSINTITLMPPRRPRHPKADALRQRGSLNPRPQAVRDPLFASGAFFDPRDLVQVKYEMVRRVRVDGRAVRRSAQDFGFSRPAFYHAQSALADGGLAALVPKKPGPRRAHKLSAEVMAFLAAAVCARSPHCGQEAGGARAGALRARRAPAQHRAGVHAGGKKPAVTAGPDATVSAEVAVRYEDRRRHILAGGGSRPLRAAVDPPPGDRKYREHPAPVRANARSRWVGAS